MCSFDTSLKNDEFKVNKVYCHTPVKQSYLGALRELILVNNSIVHLMDEELELTGKSKHNE